VRAESQEKIKPRWSKSSDVNKGRLQMRKTAVKIDIVIETLRKSLFPVLELLAMANAPNTKLTNTTLDKRIRFARCSTITALYCQSEGVTALTIVADAIIVTNKNLVTSDPK
jgi:hypothetical protein